MRTVTVLSFINNKCLAISTQFKTKMHGKLFGKSDKTNLKIKTKQNYIQYSTEILFMFRNQIFLSPFTVYQPLVTQVK